MGDDMNSNRHFVGELFSGLPVAAALSEAIGEIRDDPFKAH